MLSLLIIFLGVLDAAAACTLPLGVTDTVTASTLPLALDSVLSL
jgi:hypothetical protein